MSRARVHTVFVLVLLFLLPAFLSSCASMSDVVKDKDKGTSVTYPVTTAQGFEIARTVFRWEGCDAIEEHEDQGYMLTTIGATVYSQGAVMGAWVEPAGTGATKVTVVTRRRFAIDFTTLTETTFHKRFQQAVDILHSGKPLPAQRPLLPGESEPE